jgi:hypothetical protein
MIMNNKIATTVKVDNALYDEFKVLGVRHKLTLQGLVEKSIYRYVNDDSYRETINNFFLPVTLSFITAVTSSIPVTN